MRTEHAVGEFSCCDPGLCLRSPAAADFGASLGGSLICGGEAAAPHPPLQARQVMARGYLHALGGSAGVAALGASRAEADDVVWDMEKGVVLRLVSQCVAQVRREMPVSRS